MEGDGHGPALVDAMCGIVLEQLPGAPFSAQIPKRLEQALQVVP